MKSRVIKRSIVLAGHKTSVSLEDPFWAALKEMAASRQMTLSTLVMSIDTERQYSNLSSCLRVYVLDFYRVRPVEHRDARSSPHDVVLQPAKSA